MSTIRLYWFKDIKNVGDFLNLYLLKGLTGINVIRYVNPSVTPFIICKRLLLILLRKKKQKYIFGDYLFPWQKHYLCIGSILDKANSKSIVWGSGFREYDNKIPKCKIFAVRGKLSLEVLRRNKFINLDSVALGDPALLLPLLYKPQNIEKKYKVSIIPHYRDYYSFRTLNKSYHVIDVQTENIEEFVNEIIRSEFILSSSLHGLIIAHAYGIPALWIRYNDVRSSEFKYFDYFSSVGIKYYLGLTNINELFSSIQSVYAAFSENSDKACLNIPLKFIQEELLRTCPFHILKSIIKDAW